MHLGNKLYVYIYISFKRPSCITTPYHQISNEIKLFLVLDFEIDASFFLKFCLVSGNRDIYFFCLITAIWHLSLKHYTGVLSCRSINRIRLKDWLITRSSLWFYKDYYICRGQCMFMSHEEAITDLCFFPKFWMTCNTLLKLKFDFMFLFYFCRKILGWWILLENIS